VKFKIQIKNHRLGWYIILFRIFPISLLRWVLLL